ncbi:hypothetical protein [Kitasatospora viridis]|uniref:Uncharacterized protein n=1 Tax=Kitasatospora viridis TaxID=281105 RepID=A0A561SA07_9ACTN|nr:hypothetical protein [Kitasatospora viridis]TWF71706.1 hypothetical protein FHX73_1877 [Kitasatospora viridis]
MKRSALAANQTYQLRLTKETPVPVPARLLDATDLWAYRNIAWDDTLHPAPGTHRPMINTPRSGRSGLLVMLPSIIPLTDKAATEAAARLAMLPPLTDDARTLEGLRAWRALVGANLLLPRLRPELVNNSNLLAPWAPDERAVPGGPRPRPCDYCSQPVTYRTHDEGRHWEHTLTDDPICATERADDCNRPFQP